MKIKDARSLSAAAQEAIRQRAVAAVLDGMKQTKVAKVFGVTRQALGKWLKAYRENGFKSLKARPQGRPKGGSLAPWQAAQIVKTLINRTPDQPDFPSCLWTRAAVCYLIEQRFEMQLSVWTVGRYLKRWGFTPQKPIRRALEKDPKSVKKWLAEDYPAIRKEAKKEKAQIYWCDEMGLRSDQFAGRSFSKRGRKPVVSRTGKRFGCNMISAVANVGTLYFMLFKENFDADIFLSFLKRLVRQSQTKVFLIVDRHPVHRAHKVQQWLDKHSEHIRLFFLPVYSPELNPNELLNQDVKGNAVGKRGARNLRELLKNVRSYLFRRQRQPHIIRRYFIEKHVRYAAT
jgi:transposase